MPLKSALEDAKDLFEETRIKTKIATLNKDFNDVFATMRLQMLNITVCLFLSSLFPTF